MRPPRGLLGSTGARQTAGGGAGRRAGSRQRRRDVRAAEAFGATGVAFLKGTVNPYNPKCLRASAGSVFRLPVAAADRAGAFCRPRWSSKRVTLYAALPRAASGRLPGGFQRRRARSSSAAKAAASARNARARATGVRIPTSGVESLNAAVAAASPVVRGAAAEGSIAMSLFDTIAAPARRRSETTSRPLAERMRPERLEDFVGQQHILGPGKPLRVQIERDQLQSLILWGPPGVGKTTLARLDRAHHPCEFIPFSAVLSGIKEIKAVMADAERAARAAGAARWCSSMKFTASTKPSRTPFCPTSSAATSS